MYIDFHTHCFPDALAPRAMERLKDISARFDFIKAHTNGTASDAKRVLSAAGITHAVVCNIATNERQETNVNDFAISLTADPFFSPLGSIHPDSEKKAAELDRLAAAGIKGIKLHPDYVRVPLSDPRFDEILSLAEERGLFVVVHAGLDPVSPDLVHATPDMFAAAIKRHPNLTLIAAHMGGFAKAKEVLEHLVGTGIYLDTSLCSLREGEKDLLYKILAEHDPTRLLFATDTPWSDASREVAFLEGAPIDEWKKKMIRAENAARLLGL